MTGKKRIMAWRPMSGDKRSSERPPARWSDSLKGVNSAQDRANFRELEEFYVQQAADR